MGELSSSRPSTLSLQVSALLDEKLHAEFVEEVAEEYAEIREDHFEKMKVCVTCNKCTAMGRQSVTCMLFGTLCTEVSLSPSSLSFSLSLTCMLTLHRTSSMCLCPQPGPSA